MPPSLKLDKQLSIPRQLFQTLRCIKHLEFISGHPLLSMYEDGAGTVYLSLFLTFIDKRIEQRCLVTVSPDRLLSVQKGEESVKELFTQPENSGVYIAQQHPDTGELYTLHFYTEFSEDFFSYIPKELEEPKELDHPQFSQPLAERARRFDKIIVHLECIKALKPESNSIFLERMVLPFVASIQSLIPSESLACTQMHYRFLDESGRSVSLELPYTYTLFDAPPEWSALVSLMKIMSATLEDDLEKTLFPHRKSTFIKAFKKVMHGVYTRDWQIRVRIYSSFEEESQMTYLNKAKALLFQRIHSRKYADIQEKELINARFLEIDALGKEHTCKIQSIDSKEIHTASISDKVWGLLKENPVILEEKIYELLIRKSTQPGGLFKEDRIRRTIERLSIV